MGVLAPGSAHVRPSTQPPIYMSENYPAHMSEEEKPRKNKNKLGLSWAKLRSSLVKFG